MKKSHLHIFVFLLKYNRDICNAPNTGTIYKTPQTGHRHLAWNNCDHIKHSKKFIVRKIWNIHTYIEVVFFDSPI